MIGVGLPTGGSARSDRAGSARTRVSNTLTLARFGDRLPSSQTLDRMAYRGHRSDHAGVDAAVLCFFGDVVREVVPARPEARQVTALTSELGSIPGWELEVGGQRLVVLQPGVGAPMAAALPEEIIAMGARRFAACGGAGALAPELELGRAVVVDSAVRDEGTSHHYVPASGVIDADPHAVTTVANACEVAGVAQVLGRSWTTDAIIAKPATG